jgi:hypothetical protein
MTIRDDYEETAASVGKLVAEKQKAYGDSFNKSCKILEVLFPDGVQPENYKDFLAVTRVIDKLFRIATDKDALGESPWKDIMGYALLSLSADMEEKEKNEKDAEVDIPLAGYYQHRNLPPPSEVCEDGCVAYGTTCIKCGACACGCGAANNPTFVGSKEEADEVLKVKLSESVKKAVDKLKQDPNTWRTQPEPFHPFPGTFITYTGDTGEVTPPPQCNENDTFCGTPGSLTFQEDDLLEGEAAPDEAKRMRRFPPRPSFFGFPRKKVTFGVR